MSKVICDVCGTAFPETAENCPICGCAKAPTATVINSDDIPAEQESASTGNYTRGGRFAKNNVKRTSRSRAPEGRFSGERNRQNEPQPSNKGLVAVVIILLLAIVAVVIYIGVNVFLTDAGNMGAGSSQNSTDGAGDAIGGGSQDVVCTEIKLNSKTVELKTENEQYSLVAQLQPENLEATVTFVSADPSVATVDANGLIVGVGYGQTTITATCGTVSAECTVICTFGTPPTTEPATQPLPTAPAGFVLKLITYKDSGEITISKEGGSHQLYKETNGVKPSDIQWTTSDPAVVTVENGKVIGVDRGIATVTASIGDQTATCRVICAFDAAEPTEPAPYTISHNDVTIGQGESFFLSLKDANGAKAQGVDWKASTEGVVEIDEGKITGGSVSKLTSVTISTEYEGVKYSCKVYVKAAEQ